MIEVVWPETSMISEDRYFWVTLQAGDGVTNR
jgi:hypothetical protein